MADPTWIPVAQPVLDGNEARYVQDCIESEWISAGGSYSRRFEEQFAAYCGVRHAATCANGTVALHLALLALGLEAGDEVIVPSLTYVASANSVRYCNATPVFADCEEDTLNLDPADIEHRITPRTRGIMVVHLYGHPCDMDPILEIARRHGLWVVEDAAEALGAQYRGRPCGSLADVATFSFFGNKLITTGEGGMVVTDRDDILAAATQYRGQGMDPKRRYWFPIIGYNYRLTNVQAAIGLAQLERIETLLARRRDVARWYDHHLADLAPVLRLPVERDWAFHSYWMYTPVLRADAGIDRDELMARLATDGIETRPIFYPVHSLPPYASDAAPLPVTDRVAAGGLNLPTHARLTESQVEFICSRVRAHCGASV